MAWPYMAAGGTGSIVFIEDANKSGRVNCEVFCTICSNIVYGPDRTGPSGAVQVHFAGEAFMQACSPLSEFRQ